MAHLCAFLMGNILIYAYGIFPWRYIFITAARVAECWLGSRVCWVTILWRLKIAIYRDASRWVFEYRPKVVIVKVCIGVLYWGVMSLSSYCVMFITDTTPIWYSTFSDDRRLFGSTSYINLYDTGGDNF